MRIITDPGVMHRAPVIKGTRIPVWLVVGSITGGMSADEIMREYEIQRDDIDAALQFASEIVKETTVIPLVSV